MADILESVAPEDQRRLREVLGLDVEADLEAVAAALVPYARAALAEYIDQFTGRAVPGRIGDAEQLRLLRIAMHANGGRLPSPDMVAQLFQKHATQAKTLLRNTATRYRYELAANMNEAAWLVLTQSARPAGDGAWNFEVRDAALLEHLHECVRRGPGNPRGIEAVRGEMHVYSLDEATAQALLGAIGRSVEEFRAELVA